NARATKITRTRRPILTGWSGSYMNWRNGLASWMPLPGSGILQDDGVNRIADVTTHVDGLFDNLEQVLHENRAHRVIRIQIQTPIGLQQQLVGFSLQRLQAA